MTLSKSSNIIIWNKVKSVMFNSRRVSSENIKQEIKHGVSHLMVNTHQLATFFSLKISSSFGQWIKEIKGLMQQINFTAVRKTGIRSALKVMRSIKS